MYETIRLIAENAQ